MNKTIVPLLLLSFAGCTGDIQSDDQLVAAVRVDVRGAHPASYALVGPAKEADALRDDLLATLGATAMREGADSLTVAVGDDERAMPLAPDADLAAIDDLATVHQFMISAPRDTGTGQVTAALTRNSRVHLAEIADYTGNGRSQPTVWRPTTGGWSIYGYNGLGAWGQPGDLPVIGDYDGDGISDRAIYRPTTGEWWIIKSSSGAVLRYQWGGGIDQPTPGDFDGDGKTDVAVWRRNTTEIWVWSSLYGSSWRYQFGNYWMQPVMGDYDGDGKTDPALGYPNAGWTYLSSRTHTYVTLPIVTSNSGAAPIPADYDGDGKTDPAVYLDGQFAVAKSATGYALAWTNLGVRGDRTVTGDFDGDGKADFTVFGNADGVWYWMSSALHTVQSFQFGLRTDQPVPWRYYWSPPIQL